MQDMMKMYGGGMDMSMFGAEGETLVLNANHPLVTYITEHEDDANTQIICEFRLRIIRSHPDQFMKISRIPIRKP